MHRFSCASSDHSTSSWSITVKTEGFGKAKPSVTPNKEDRFNKLVEDLEEWIGIFKGYMEPSSTGVNAGMHEKSLRMRLQKRRHQHARGELDEDMANRLNRLGVPGFTIMDQVNYGAHRESCPQKIAGRRQPTKKMEIRHTEPPESPANRKERVFKPESVNRDSAKKRKAITIRDEYNQGTEKAKKSVVETTDHSNLPVMKAGQTKVEPKYKRIVYCTVKGESISKVANYFCLSNVNRIVADNLFQILEGDLTPKAVLPPKVRLVLYMPED